MSEYPTDLSKWARENLERLAKDLMHQNRALTEQLAIQEQNNRSLLEQLRSEWKQEAGL